ncbi:hypothetical protein SAMN06265375_102191 [Muriicola jejuensis]|uniref:Metal-dependent hydrolase n=1 Tax=Muriicola jejuensis TaxID=504488 RepID=A0A6P0UCR3_9FLAO|nr:DUF6122 family protein [Muriicola jejuensis]NER10827.1 hypothetical protein [Muriicola jejuensis]SMP16177.1 hypothetical protein SAMN06265375_102191 [Muriicola jejuensis]
MLRLFLHYGIHFLLPFAVAFLFYRARPWRAVLILLSAILIDLDHLWADPIFDPNRCSINFHPLHTYWAMGVYTLFLFFKPLRIWGIGLLLHMLADWTDCLFIGGEGGMMP